MASTLLDASLKSARGVLCSITGSGYTTLEVNDAAQPDIDLPSTGAMGAIGIPGLPVDRPGDGEIGQA